MLDGGRYFYRTYLCSDGGYIAVGAIEPQFRKALLKTLGLDEEPLFTESDPSREAERIERLAALFLTRSRDDWAQLFEYVDACVTPVLSMEEAERFSVNMARTLFVEAKGVTQPAPAPRFENHPDASRKAFTTQDADLSDILQSWGHDQNNIR